MNQIQQGRIQPCEKQWSTPTLPRESWRLGDKFNSLESVTGREIRERDISLKEVETIKQQLALATRDAEEAVKINQL